MYADNHQIYHSGHDLVEVTSKLSESTDQATKWYKSNLLAGNLKKYQTFNIGCSRTNDSGTSAVIYNNNQKIKTADTLKLLGITTDSNLNFSEHVSSACIKASHTSAYNLRQSYFSTPRYFYLWKALSADRSAKTLQAFTNCTRKRDIPRLTDTGCKDCILCCT